MEGQLRFADELITNYAHKLVYVDGLGWHVWDSKRWRADGTTATSVRSHGIVIAMFKKMMRKATHDDPFGKEPATKALHADIRRCNNIAGIRGTLDCAAPRMLVETDAIDADPYLLNVANGTLDLRALAAGEQRVLKPHDPKDMITKLARAAWRPETKPGAWAEHLKVALPEDDSPGVAAYLARGLGSALIGKVLDNTLTILTGTGTGGNGKGTVIEAVLHALGDYALTAEAELLNVARPGKATTGVLDLMGRRIAFISETEAGQKMDAAAMKRYTGGDSLRARAMRRDFVEFMPSHTLFMVTNYLPEVRGDDEAVWRRMRVVEFLKKMKPKHDIDMSATLQAAADEILQWLVTGLGDYQDNGGLKEPKDVLAAIAEYKSDSDAVAAWIEECCVKGPQAQSTHGVLFKAFKKWCDDEGRHSMASKQFAQALDRAGFRCQRTNGKRLRPGIMLSPEYSDDHPDGYGW